MKSEGVGKGDRVLLWGESLEERMDRKNLRQH